MRREVQLSNKSSNIRCGNR